MSITPYLDEFDADPETRRVLAVTLEMTRVSLGLTDDLADGIIAKQIVELARAGERHPDLLCDGVIEAPRLRRFANGPACSVRGCIRPSFARPKGAPS